MKQWIAPSEKDSANELLEKRLWDAADQFRANSGLKAQEYSAPVLGLIFLRFAEVRFAIQRAKLEKAGASSRRGSRVDEPAAYHAEGILFLPVEARFDYLLNLPEAENIGAKVNAAMRDIEKQNTQLAGVLPKTYNLFASTLLKELLKKVSEIPASLDYDAFGRIYEYFLGEFAMSEGQGGGEFYTPSSIVRLLTEVIEPYHGRILDPACGSGGMFVSSARFVSEHKHATRTTPSPPTPLPKGEGGKYSGDPARELSIFGVEKTDETGRLCRLNLAVHGLEGEIRHGGNVNSYYDDPFDACGASIEPSSRPSGHPSPTSSPSGRGTGEGAKHGRGGATANLPSTSGRGVGGEGAGNVAYRDVAGLCKAATLKEIEAQGWSLNPGRYVGVAAGEAVSDEDFKEQLETLNEELETLNAAARELEATIAGNVAEILET